MRDEKNIRRGLLLFVGVLLFYGGTVGVASIVKNSFYGEIDTVQYLREAKNIAQDGGLMGLLLSHLKGEYIPTAVVQPFFPTILSYFAVEGVDFYVHAKLITAFIGLCALLLSFLLLRKEFGFWEAVMAVTVVAVSSHVLFYFTIVAVEPLFMLTTMLAWYAGLQALRTNSMKWSFLTGLSCFAVYMCKGYGYFLLGAWGLSLFLMNPRDFWKEKRFYFVPLSFVFVGLPVFINNMIQYHTPLYTSQSALIWVDDFLDFYTPEYQLHGATLTSYLETHTVGHLVWRHVAGVVKQFRLISLLARPVFAPGMTQNWWIFLLGPLTALGWWKDQDTIRKRFSLFVFLAFFFVGVLTVSVYEVTRIYLPFLPIILVYAVCGLFVLVKTHAEKLKCWGGIACLFLMLAMGFFAIATGRLGNPLTSVEVNRDVAALENLLETKMREDDKVFWSPSHSNLLWTTRRLMNQSSFLLRTANWRVINEKAERENIQWLVVDRELFQRHNDLFSQGHVELGEEGLIPVAEPPGWFFVEHDQNPPSDWILYHRESE